jgi:hypothetical protein
MKGVYGRVHTAVSAHATRSSMWQNKAKNSNDFNANLIQIPLAAGPPASALIPGTTP